ncbi:MAG: hypothetical protein ABIN67_03980 [Ferruginibacter sp.]
MKKNYLPFVITLALPALISCSGPGTRKLNQKSFPFSIELNSIDPGQYDPSTGKWVQTTMQGRSEVIFKYTLKNKIMTLPGEVTARIGNIALLSSGAFANTVPQIAPGENFSSEFHTYALPPGAYELYFTYSKKGSTGFPNPGGGFQYKDSIISEDLFYYFVPPDLVDNDLDSIDDREEKRLLDKYSPFYSFSKEGDTEEQYLPTDVLTYIRGSRLIQGTDEDGAPIQLTNFALAQNPHALLFSIPTSAHPTSSSLMTNAKNLPTTYHIDPADQVRKGSSWEECKNQRNIGLYGHVVPYNESSGQKDVHDLFMPNAKTFYKIEYWQFFGYNSANPNPDLADHEGDWTSVQLLYDPHPGNGEDSIVSVFHYVHGLEFRFDMSAKTKDTTAGTIREITGANARFNPDINIIKLGPNKNFVKSDDFDQTQNNIVRFKQDPATLKYTHPIVYIEYGTHEFYPSEYWKYSQAPNHDGTGTREYFCAVPPNLGEVEHLLPEYEGADIIMHFNGSWGAFSSQNNDPGPGPSLHAQWMYPASTSIGWMLHGLPF